jgi:hypothetical protein
MPLGDDHLRLGILDKPGELGRRVGGIERDVDQASAQAGEIEQGPLDGLLRLDENPVAGVRTESDQRRRIAPDGAVQPGIGQPDLAALNEKRRPSGKGRRVFEQAVEIAAQIAAFRSSTRSVFSQGKKSPSGVRPK